MKKLLSATLATVFAFILLCSPALALVAKSDSFYVQDKANVLSDVTKNGIIDYNAGLEKLCSGAQIVVVTMDYNDENIDSEEYAWRLHNEWGVGDSTNQNGMLLLLFTAEKKGWLSIGPGIVEHWGGNKAGKLLDEYFWPLSDAGRHDEAVQSLFVQLLEWYDGYYGTSVYQTVPQDGQNFQQYTPTAYDKIFSSLRTLINIVMIIAVIIAVCLLIRVFSRPSRRRHYNNYRVGTFYPFFFFSGGRRRYRNNFRNPPPPPGFGNTPKSPPRNNSSGGFGGGGRSGSSGGFGGRSGGFGGGMGRGGGGRSGGGGGRR